MRRRTFLAAGLAAPTAGAAPAPQGRVEPEIVRLKLRHTWTTVMSSSDYRDTLHLRLTRDGATGTGEGAPIVRYKESAESARKAVESMAAYLGEADWRAYDKVLRTVFSRVEGEWAAKAAIDIALMDWVTQKLGIPLHRHFGLDAADAPLTTFSIGIDNPQVTKQKVAEAADYPVLKIKVGLESDDATMEAVRSVTKKPLRVDANEGWKTKEEALRKIRWLETQGVELIEQPMAAHMRDDIAWLRGKVNIPIIADEACLQAPDVATAAGAYDGVNIKLDKCGGVLEAYKMIQIARSLGLKVMIGCMISSSVTVTAAAHLSPLVDWADLDGNLLIANDPYEGVTVKQGRLVLPSRPGLGLRRRTVKA